MDDEREQRDALQEAVAVALAVLLVDVADGLAALVVRAGRRGTVTPTGRDAILSWLGDTIARLFGASPAAAAAAYATLGTVPQLLAASTRAAVLIAAPTGGVPGVASASTRAWRDPNGLILSDRIWLAGGDARSRLTAVLDAGLARGARPDALARELKGFIRPDTAGRTVRGDQAFWSARRLAAHEINRVHGVATIARARGAGDLVAWERSARHVGPDICSIHAASGPYAPDKVPAFPAHTGCLCHLRRVPGGSPSSVAPLGPTALIEALTGFRSGRNTDQSGS